MAMHLVKQRFRRAIHAGAAVRMRPVFDDFHRLTMKGDHEYPAHRHGNYELILVEHGPYRCRLNNAELSLGEGQILVIKPGDEHQDHLRCGQRHYVVHFRIESAAPGDAAIALFSEGIQPALQVCRGNHRRDAAMILELRREAEAGGRHAAAIQDCLLEALFWRVVRDLPEESLAPEMRRLPQEEALREKIAETMQRRIKDNPTVTDIAGELGISPRHLANLCRKLFGESPARCHLRLKIRHAEQLLRYQRLRVKEVSEALGFANPFHFSRVYRRVMGRPPSLA